VRLLTGSVRPVHSTVAPAGYSSTARCC